MKARATSEQPIMTIENDDVFVRKLDKANLVINQFIRSCSHSMRGPLKSIRGLINLLKQSPGDPVSLMNYMDDSVDKMETMLDELEQFMINSSKHTDHSKIDINELILRSVTGVQRDIKKNAIELNVQAEQSSPFYSDAARLRLVLTHLMMNAIMFQKAGEGRKKINIRCFANAEECQISVEDNGIGIDPNEQENIFKLFYRATAESSGAGIGLFVVHEALEKMKGKIRVDSKPGRGSTFTFSVPNEGVSGVGK